MSEPILVSIQELRTFCGEVLQRLGVPAEDSSIIAEVLTDADLKGHDTHGIAVLPAYVRALRAGYVNRQPQIRIVKESANHALIDGDHGMGQLVGAKAMKICIAKAKKSNVAMVNVMNPATSALPGTIPRWL